MLGQIGQGSNSEDEIIKVSSLLGKQRHSEDYQKTNEFTAFSPTAQRNRQMVIENINALIKARQKHENT